MYKQLYDIISNFLFNGDPSQYAYGELICEAIPAIACTLLIAVPFFIVYRVIKLIVG